MSFAVKLILILLPILVQSEKFNKLYDMITYHSGKDITNFVIEANLTCTIRDEWYARMFFYDYDKVSPNDFIAEAEIYGKGNDVHQKTCVGYQDGDSLLDTSYNVKAVIYHDCADEGREKKYDLDLLLVPAESEKNVTVPVNEVFDNKGSFLIPAHFKNIDF